MTRRCVRRGMVRAAAVCADRQRAVHDARVQLLRLCQTNGEPDGEHSGQTAEERVASHSSNIELVRLR